MMLGLAIRLVLTLAALSALGGAIGCRDISANGFPASEDGRCPEGFVVQATRCYRPGGGGFDARTSTVGNEDAAGLGSVDARAPGGSDAAPAPPSSVLDGSNGVPPDGGPPGARLDASLPPGVDAGVAGTLENVVAVATSTSLTCAVLAGGSVACWGFNDQGVFGDRETIAVVPAPILGLVGATGIVTGASHACAIVAAGEVRCWGRGGGGALGDGEIGGFHFRTSPVTAIGLRGARALSAGTNRTCALVSGGSAYCWGYDPGGGTDELQGVPTLVPGLSNVAVMASGQGHTCVALENGSVQCWGFNEGGELGRGEVTQAPVDTGPIPLGPGPVVGIGDVSYLAAGARHTCAIVSQNRGVRCWGANTSGQLGDGTQVGSPIPVVVTGVTGARTITAGAAHTCAVLEDGLARCWGSNASGQLGNGRAPQDFGFSAVAVAVEVGGITDISGRGSHTCAVLANRTVRCWGANGVGQLGIGATSSSSSTPVPVSAARRVD